MVAALFAGCDRQPLEPVPEDALTPSLKVGRLEFMTVESMEPDPPVYNECA
jgi:hypothetical protein